MRIYRCFNVLNRQVELSEPQVISYLMNWDDHFVSHKYFPVYWGQLSNALRLVFPDLGHSQAASMFGKINESTTDKDKNDVSIIDI
jgi:hypothetical protein